MVSFYFQELLKYYLFLLRFLCSISKNKESSCSPVWHSVKPLNLELGDLD